MLSAQSHPLMTDYTDYTVVLSAKVGRKIRRNHTNDPRPLPHSSRIRLFLLGDCCNPNSHFRNLKWRYLPYIRPMVQDLSPQNLAWNMVQYLHSILKWPLTRPFNQRLPPVLHPRHRWGKAPAARGAGAVGDQSTPWHSRPPGMGRQGRSWGPRDVQEMYKLLDVHPPWQENRLWSIPN